MEKTKVNEIELYENLVSDLKDIITERVWNSRVEIIVGHGEIGQRVLEDPLYKKYSKQHKDFLDKLARSIGISYSELCRSIQFYQKFKLVSPDGESWDKLKEGKNVSWALIKQKYLPMGGAKEITLTPKYKLGAEVKVEFSGVIIGVKDTPQRVVYKIETEIAGEKEDIWIEERFLKGL